MMERAIIAVALLVAVGGHASAQSYPNRPIRFINPNPAGGANDAVGRIVAQKLSEILGQQVVVDNRGGAGGVIGAEIAARAAPDGYTMFSGSFATHAIAPHVYRKVPYDAIRDFIPISLFVVQHNVLAAHPGFAPNTVKEIIALAKAKPGYINYGSAGPGSTSHFAGVLFQRMAGVEMNHVPYKGGGAVIPAVVAGEVSYNFGPAPAVVALIKGKRLKAIATSGSTRMGMLPDVPTVAESGVPGYASSGWFGLMAPAKTPKPILDRLHAATMQALNDAGVRNQLINLGADPMPQAPEEFARFVRDEYERYGKLVKEAGLTVD